MITLSINRDVQSNEKEYTNAKKEIYAMLRILARQLREERRKEKLERLINNDN